MAGRREGREDENTPENVNITKLHTALVGAMYGVLSRQLSGRNRASSGTPLSGSSNRASTSSNHSREPARESCDSDEDDFVQCNTSTRPTNTPLPVCMHSYEIENACNSYEISIVNVSLDYRFCQL